MSGVDTRNINRDSLFMLAELTVSGRTEPVRVKVRNLSAGGMMAEGQFDMERGARVTVKVRNIGEVAGSVAWVQGERFGIAFEKEIDPKLARAQIGGDTNSAPSYTKSTVAAPGQGGWNQGYRKI